MLNTIVLQIAKKEPDFAQAADLIQEYVIALGVDLSFQDLIHELWNLRQMYGPPSGGLILAWDQNLTVGCTGIRKWAPGIVELKRMYVVPKYRKFGVGVALLERALDEARDLGYHRIRLDTLAEMTAAQALYIKKGFYEIPPYRNNPLPGTKYFELIL